MTDIARLAGVSASTVSRALAGSPLVATAKRVEIHRLARERGYVINSTARNLRLQRTQALSVVMSLTDPFFMEMLGHLADAITRRGYGMFLQKVVPPMSDWLPQLIASHKSDGIIVVDQGTGHTALEAAAASYKPLVVWGGHLVRQSYCTVGSDNVGGALAAVDHLIRLGRRRIAFLGDPAVPEIGLRYEGYRLAHERAGREFMAPHIVPSHLKFIGSAGNVDAVVGATDVIAMRALRAVTAAGLAVPRDVAVVGFGDIALASLANPPLTTVRQDLQRGAHTLVDLLFRRIEGEDTPSVTMPAELVVRESSG